MAQFRMFALEHRDQRGRTIREPRIGQGAWCPPDNCSSDRNQSATNGIQPRRRSIASR